MDWRLFRVSQRRWSARFAFGSRDPAWLRSAFAKHEGHAKTLRRKDE